MANWQVISLDTTTPQLRAPGTGDGYSFNSGSTQLGVWTTTGLGVGTANPGGKLVVSNAGAAGIEFYPTGGVGGGPYLGTYNRSTSAYIPYTNYASTHTWFVSTAGNVRAMDLDTSGNLGLGVTPGSWTSNAKAMQFSSLGMVWQQTNGDFNLGYNTLETSANSFVYKLSSIAATRFSASDSFKWYTAASGTAGNTISFTQAMTLDANANLQLNTTTNKVTQFGGSATGMTIGSATYPVLSLWDTGDASWNFCLAQDGGTAFLYNNANGPMAFYTNGTERARITSGGFFKATSDGTYVSSTGSYHEFRTNAADWTVRTSSTTSTAANCYGIYVKYSNAAPNNTGNDFLYCEDNAVTRLSLRSNGGLANYQANDVNLSDARVKTDVKPVGSYWDKIKGIEIVTFKYKDQTHSDDNIGVIAQQVESVAPEFIDVDGFGETPEDGVPLKTVYTTDMYHAAIKALQEAMARIEKLEAEVAALEAK